MSIKRTCPICGARYFAIARDRCPRCDGIDFDNIRMIYLADAETVYRLEAEEEFDPVVTDILSGLDGWQHFETRTVEYLVEDGENYTFVIIYSDGTDDCREYHSSSPFAKRLLGHEKCFDVAEDTQKIADRVGMAFERVGQTESAAE